MKTFFFQKPAGTPNRLIAVLLNQKKIFLKIDVRRILCYNITLLKKKWFNNFQEVSTKSFQKKLVPRVCMKRRSY